jgi:hypothetical protein
MASLSLIVFGDGTIGKMIKEREYRQCRVFKYKFNIIPLDSKCIGRPTISNRILSKVVRSCRIIQDASSTQMGSNFRILCFEFLYLSGEHFEIRISHCRHAILILHFKFIVLVVTLFISPEYGQSS